ncbi:hypothetical protein CALCODRAFT_520907 [Calocera cornea HHB12733]|uniref:Uncharacterized protein n=1 Tax=Calocera cornea HHB12733 TaxID=1353952 RepID=A0A165D5J8_9BASI|nr:hypothetical protein CALCODRAFT_520907 [Calocera cornea HHB12733]
MRPRLPPVWARPVPPPALACCAVLFVFVHDELNDAYLEANLTYPRTRRRDRHPRVLLPRASVEVLGAYPLSKYDWIGVGYETEVDGDNEDENKEGKEVTEDANAKRAQKGQQGKDSKKDDGNKPDHSKIYRSPAPTEPTAALVRQLHLDPTYGSTFIQNELLTHGISQAVTVPSLEVIYLRLSKLTPWLEEVSKTMGMRRRAGPTGEELARDVGRRGLMGCREWYVGVGRETWEERYEEMREMHGLWTQ